MLRLAADRHMDCIGTRLSHLMAYHAVHAQTCSAWTPFCCANQAMCDSTTVSELSSLERPPAQGPAAKMRLHGGPGEHPVVLPKMQQVVRQHVRPHLRGVQLLEEAA